jgi:transposase
VYIIPDQTAAIARAAFPKGNPYLRMRDTLGPIYINPEFTALFSTHGRPAEAPAQLALVTIMQFAEGLTDAQAADAVRSRIDWKYALALELTDPGFDASVLCEFRARLIAGNAEHLLFESMLTLFRDHGLVKARGRQRTDSTHVLAAIHTLNRLELLGETLRHALNRLASAAPAWLRTWVPADWFDRYGRQISDYRLPASKAERDRLTAQIGGDGRSLLTRLYDPPTPAWLRDLPAVHTLRHVWMQQFYAVDPTAPMQVRRKEDLPPSSLRICSPYDPDARYRCKRTTEWVGYAVHLTESCEDEQPHLITDVATTPATTADNQLLGEIHDRLAQRDLTPAEHFVDAGYMTADHLVRSRQQATTLIGPVIAEQSWQARAGLGFGVTHFAIDWDRQQAQCPQGKPSRQWKPTRDRDGHAVVAIRFDPTDCAACPVRSQCVKTDRARSLMIRPQAQHEALQAARADQHTEAFKAKYYKRAGVEGTISQGVRLTALRRSRYIGLAKTRLVHLLIAASLNFVRVAAWLAEPTHAHTRRSAFAALAPT